MNNHWTLVFRAEGDGPPVEIRVRKLLKAALRCYRLRCVQVRGDDSPEEFRGNKAEDNEKKEQSHE